MKPIPNITNAYAVNFCNVRLRPAADLLAQSYYRAIHLIARWTSLGSGQAALDQMQADFKAAANKLIAGYDWAYWTEKVWFLPNSLSTLIPNDLSPVFDNGSFTAQDPNRPAITGAMVNNLITRCQQCQNWLLSATGSFTDSARGSVSWFNTVAQCGSDAPTTIVLADAQNFVTRCSELKTNYEATSSANLNTILGVAVNPNL